MSANKRVGEIQGEWITPDWPAPAAIKGVVTTRSAMLTAGPYGAFNTADHVGDDPQSVASCRRALQEHFGFRHPPVWLNQVHGIQVVSAVPGTPRQDADAVTTRTPGLPITIHTADCLPVFLCNRAGTQVALAHAGWRGLAGGVIEAAVATFADSRAELLAWLGPAIGPAHFEVGGEVREAFLRHDPQHESAFRRGEVRDGKPHWWCDMYLLARQRLAALQVDNVWGGAFCTVAEERFFSFRRDKITGRMLSLLWIEPLDR